MSLLQRFGCRITLPPLRAAALCCIGFVLACALPVQAEVAKEYEVRLAYLLNFARYASWPVPHPDNAITMCIAADTELAERLQVALTEKKLTERNWHAVNVKLHDDLAVCSVLYIANRNATNDHVKWLEMIRNLPVLSVGDNDSFLRNGGAMRFLVRDNTIHFEVQLRNVRRNGVDLSSRLLQHADIVYNEDNVPAAGSTP